jgi:hypothetical protein
MSASQLENIRNLTHHSLRFLGGGTGRRRWALVALPAALAAGLALVPAAASHAATAHLATASTPARAAAVLPALTLKMDGKAIVVGGSLKSGAERIVSTVTDKAEAANGADPTLVRLDPGVTYPQFFAVLAKLGGPASSSPGDPNLLYGVAQIVYSTQANLGTSTGILRLAPGSYVALDLGVQGQPPLATFTVAKAANPAPLPKPGGTISSIEFGFTGPVKLHDGELVRWANAGYVVHMIVGAEAPSLAKAKQIAALMKAGKDNAAQGLAVGFFGWDGALSHGESFETVINQHPGYWVIVCFMDTQDHREHTTLGMERVIQIVK